MAAHVICQVRAAAGISEISVLSPLQPDFADVHWLKDAGRGLNGELASVLGQDRVLVIHADLPLLNAADVDALLAEASRAGAAIAPDRAGTGTNALALVAPAAVKTAFGVDSFALHKAMFPAAAIIKRPGLALDIDFPEDLDLATAAGALPIACPI